jgi:hypothetical protein
VSKNEHRNRAAQPLEIAEYAKPVTAGELEAGAGKPLEDLEHGAGPLARGRGPEPARADQADQVEFQVMAPAVVLLELELFGELVENSRLHKMRLTPVPEELAPALGILPGIWMALEDPSAVIEPPSRNLVGLE